MPGKKERVILTVLTQLIQLIREGRREGWWWLAINPNTIQRAYRELETDGYICTVPGKGSFVSQRDEAAEKRKTELRAKMCELMRDLRHAGVGEEEIISLVRKEYSDD